MRGLAIIAAVAVAIVVVIAIAVSGGRGGNASAGGQAGSGSTGAGTDPAASAGTDGAVATQTPDQPEIAPGTWVTVLGSFSQKQDTLAEARALADRLSSEYEPSVYVIDSSHYQGLNPGWWAVVLIGSESNSEARDLCTAVGRSPGADCYGRLIKG